MCDVVKRLLRFICVLLPLLSYGKSGDEHVKDMMSVFGPSDKKELEQFFENLTSLIDRPEPGLTMRIRGIAPRFTQGPYTHRLYFHWGFNGDPKDSWALLNRVTNATDDVQIQEMIFDEVRAVDIARKNKALLYVQISFVDLTNRSSGLSPDEINAIATLAYDTHILGDYIVGTATTSKALMPMDKIAADIIKAFGRIKRRDKAFQENPERKTLMKMFELKMKKASKHSQQRDSSQKQADAAKAMLQAMQEMVPKLLRMTDRIRRMLQLKDLEEEKKEEEEFRKAA